MTKFRTACLIPVFLIAAAAAPAAAEVAPTSGADAPALTTGITLDDLAGGLDLTPAAFARGGRGGGRRRGGGDGGDGGGRRRRGGGDGGDGDGERERGDRPTRDQILEKYDANGNGKLDPEERETMQRDRRRRRGGGERGRDGRGRGRGGK